MYSTTPCTTIPLHLSANSAAATVPPLEALGNLPLYSAITSGTVAEALALSARMS